MIALALFATFLTGMALLILLKLRPANGWIMLGCTFFMGSIGLGLWTYGLMIARISVAFPGLLAAPLLLGMLAFWIGDRSVLRTEWPRPSLGSLVVIASILFAVGGALSWNLLGYDGELYYTLKARSIVYHGTFWNADFTEAARLHLAKSRPLLLPSIYADFFMLADTTDHRMLRLWFALIHAGALCMLIDRFRPRTSWDWAWVTVFAWLPVLWHDSGGVFTGYADTLLGILFLLAFDCFRTRDHGLAIFSLTAAVLLKQDALPFLIALPLATAVTFPRQIKTLFYILIGPAAAAILWILIARHFPWSGDFDRGQLAPGSLISAVPWWPETMRMLGSKMVAPKHWGLFWIIGLAMIVTFCRRMNREDARWLLVILLQLTAYVAIQATYFPIHQEDMIRIQAMRLLLHVAPLMWMWIGMKWRENNYISSG